MNKLEDALREIQNFLKARGIPYMIIGGIGNLVWGEPRMTVDIDITVHISDANEKNFIKDAGSKFKVLVDISKNILVLRYQFKCKGETECKGHTIF